MQGAPAGSCFRHQAHAPNSHQAEALCGNQGYAGAWGSEGFMCPQGLLFFCLSTLNESSKQVRDELSQIRSELISMKNCLFRFGAALLDDIAQAFDDITCCARRQHKESVEAATSAAATASFSVYLCAQKHTARELQVCASVVGKEGAGGRGIRSSLDAIKSRLHQAKTGMQSDSSRILSAIRRNFSSFALLFLVITCMPRVLASLCPAPSLSFKSR